MGLAGANPTTSRRGHGIRPQRVARTDRGRRRRRSAIRLAAHGPGRPARNVPVRDRPRPPRRRCRAETPRWSRHRRDSRPRWTSAINVHRCERDETRESRGPLAVMLHRDDGRRLGRETRVSSRRRRTRRPSYPRRQTRPAHRSRRKGSHGQRSATVDRPLVPRSRGSSRASARLAGDSPNGARQVPRLPTRHRRCVIFTSLALLSRPASRGHGHGPTSPREQATVR